jgi:ABC-type nitrate/sulfonate/bicarbonate transport system substrate-binding protein
VRDWAKIHQQPDEVQRLVRATLRGIQLAQSNRQESVRSIMQWAGMGQGLAEGSDDMAVSRWSSNGVASARGIQLAIEEIRAELKLDNPPDPARAFDLSFGAEITAEKNSQRRVKNPPASSFAAVPVRMSARSRDRTGRGNC